MEGGFVAEGLRHDLVQRRIGQCVEERGALGVVRRREPADVGEPRAVDERVPSHLLAVLREPAGVDALAGGDETMDGVAREASGAMEEAVRRHTRCMCPSTSSGGTTGPRAFTCSK